ncbi:hypothetical protein BV25DRAFT_1820403 [Artomyces pyxidatus]|uniref:Uncharacterized protein n=1 Tax=Artomyces pyxidatus TaxID=48021 RepID=A0ACB8TDB3_9AGAM|nr:hypothetical protein BV25DRAFT_1820403 [Artomyces pyxidatus]
MNFHALMTFLALFAATLLSLVTAAPLASLELRDVYAPPVLYPHAGTIWKVGNYHNVTCLIVFLCRDTSNPPKDITNRIGEIYLTRNLVNINSMYPAAHFTFIADGDLTVTLASGFSILDGRVVVKVPDVTPGDKYAVVRKCRYLFPSISFTDRAQSWVTPETTAPSSRLLIRTRILC